ncbi:MAG: PhoPQ-activated protein PqaA family protein, partial [Pirellula sp.]
MVQLRSARMALAASIVFGLLGVSGNAEPPLGSKRTALDDYVSKPDSTYSWSNENTVQTGPLKTSVVRLKTQTWRTEKDVDRPVWEHWLVITVPENVTSDREFLLLGGGSHDSKMPTGPDAITGAIAQSTGGIVAELKNVPNQPLVFHQDGQ